MELKFEDVVSFWRSLPELWEQLEAAELPIYLYGMGDGAEKIYAVLKQREIPLKGIFASDEYVRGHSFLGYPVKKLSQVEQEEPRGFIILLAFAAFQEDLTAKLRGIAEKHPFYAPDTPVAGETLFTRDFLEQNLEGFRAVWDLLGDGKSREVLRDVVAARLTGRMDYLFACQTPEAEITDSLIPLKGRKGVLVDLGGYDGDTVRQWITASQGDYDRILTLEPDARNFKRMERKLQGWDLSRVTRVNAAAHSRKDTLTFTVRGGRNSSLQGTAAGHGGRTCQIPAESVDGLLGEQTAGLIKMDVEGNEAEALKGAAETIRRDHPPLMISAYHRTEDLFALPLLVHRLSGGAYRYFLRHHPYVPAWETNYYALPAEDAASTI